MLEMLKISCIICQDIFGPSSVVISLTCGHLFHQTCMEKWYQVKKTCPSCRKNVVQKIRIYFNDVNEAESEPTVDLEEKYERVTSRFKEVLEENKQILVERDDLQRILGVMKHKAENDSKVFKELKRELSQCIEERDKYMAMLVDYHELKKSLDEYQRIKSVLQSSKEKVATDLKNTPVNEQSVRQLLTYIDQLKEQDERHSDQRKLAISNQKQMRSELIKLRASHSQIEAELAKYREAASKNNAVEQNTRKRSQSEEIVVLDEVLDKNELPYKVIDQLKVKRAKGKVSVDLRLMPSKMLRAQNCAGAASSSRNVFDGMGGTKRQTLATRTPADELRKVFESKKNSPKPRKIVEPKQSSSTRNPFATAFRASLSPIVVQDNVSDTIEIN